MEGRSGDGGAATVATRPRWLRKRPPAVVRRLLRLPILLFRLRLGILFGHRFLVLTHRGRKSGVLHRTMLEVIRWDHARQEAVVMTPWPEHADWYRNIRAEPATEIWISRKRFRRPSQRVLPPSEVSEVMDGYARKGGMEARALRRLFGWRSDLPEGERERLLAEIAAVAFTPESA